MSAHPVAAARRGAAKSWRRRDLHKAARVGLFARAGFYLLLAYLTLRIALLHNPQGRQADANGALATVTHPMLGKVAIAVAAVGFFLLGLVRIIGAIRDSDEGVWRRVATGLHGAFYVVLSYVPVSFLAGNRSTGSDQAQHATAGKVLGLPGGQALLVCAGLVVLAVCAWQIRSALTKEYEEGMDLAGAPRWVHTAVRVAGTVGITARALVFTPIGVFLIVAGVQDDQRHSRGLDQELLEVSRHAWGTAVLVLVALGLLVFAVYTALEGRYRDLSSSS